MHGVCKKSVPSTTRDVFYFSVATGGFDSVIIHIAIVSNIMNLFSSISVSVCVYTFAFSASSL